MSVKSAPSGTRLSSGAKQAEIAQQYLKKGAQIYLEGRIQSREWTDKENQKRTSYRNRSHEFPHARLEVGFGGRRRYRSSSAAAGSADFDAGRSRARRSTSSQAPKSPTKIFRFSRTGFQPVAFDFILDCQSKTRQAEACPTRTAALRWDRVARLCARDSTRRRFPPRRKKSPRR